MQVSNSSGVSYTQNTQNETSVKTLYTQKLTKEEAQDLKAEIEKNANAFTFESFGVQNTALSVEEKFVKEYEDFQNFLSEIGYDGKNIAELSQDEAAALVSEDGFFGVDQTSQRISEFVINGANGDESLLRAGREGMIQGFQDAQEMWGGELPEISQKTMDKALEIVDKAMYDLGFSILDQEV